MAYLAMREILPYSFTSPADATVGAMVYPLCDIVVPQFANVAEVPRCSHATLLARLRSRLRGLTNHTEHVLRRMSVEYMVRLCCIVAVSARIP